MAMSSSCTRVILASKRASPLSSKTYTRAFRVGIWSSYLDPMFEKEMQRRSKILRHKYQAALNRKLSWDRQISLDKLGWKSLMCGSWKWRDARPGGRWISLNELKTAFEDYTGPDSVEQGTKWKQAPSATVQSTAKVQEHQEYEIDAISGRKIFKSSNDKHTPVDHSKSTQVPVKTFKGYRSQFSNMAPPPVINLDGPPMREEEIRKYGQPFEWNEPNGVSGQAARNTMEPSEEELNLYRKKQRTEIYDTESPPTTQQEINDYRQPYEWNEPSGEPPKSRNPMAATEEDLNLYRKRKQTATLDPDSPLTTQQELEEYKQPYQYNEPHGQIPTSSLNDPLAPTEQELASYGKKLDSKALFDEEGPKVTSQELKHYRRPFEHNETDSKQIKSADEAAYQADLDLYRKPQASNRLAAFRTMDTDTREDLDLLRPEDVRARSGIVKSKQTETHEEKAAKRAALEADYYKETEPDLIELLNKNKQQEGSSNKVLTGNFARDFPEEFSTTWTATANTTVAKANEDPWGYSKSPQGLELSYEQERENDIQAKENEHTAETTSREQYSRSASTPRLQTSLDRGGHKMNPQDVDASGYSKKPCGLETSYKEECTAAEDPSPAVYHSSYCNGTKETTTVPADPVATQATKNKERAAARDLVREIREIYESSFGIIDTKHRQTAPTSLKEASKTSDIQDLNRVINDVQRANQHLSRVRSDLQKVIHDHPSPSPAPSVQPPPTLYKILAYDPTMQEVNMAETTSITEDTSSVLTPAEVLLRLSNPTKFFPHFAPLRSEGFEIVSGSGDVLVFRKVREASTLATLSSPTNSKAAATVSSGVNSVDANTPKASASAKEQFKSNIDVRREEPVFSGGRAAWDEQHQGAKSKREKGGVAKRLLIGAGWVAACSYAVGVVGEFFTTGGSEGTGSVGL